MTDERAKTAVIRHGADRPAETRDVEDVVEALGADIDRSVALFDTSLGLLAYSRHANTDPLRTSTIMLRRPPAEAMEVAESLAISSARQPFRVPAIASLGSGSRVCVPVVSDGSLSGYLFILDPDETLDKRGLEMAVVAASECAVALLARQRARQARRRSMQTLLEHLLDEDPSAVHTNSAIIVDQDALPEGVPLVAIVVTLDPEPESEDIEPLLGMFEHARSRVGQYHAVEAWRDSHGVMLIDWHDESVVKELATELHREMSTSLPADVDIHVGIGGPVSDFKFARTSYTQALGSARVGKAITGRGPITDWADLATYRLLSLFPYSDLRQDDLPVSLLRIIGHDLEFDGPKTLECYLDNGCSIKRSAADLGIHRTTLYYRLQRLSEVGRFEVTDGEALMDLHLGLKLLRLQRAGPRGSATEL